MIKATYIDHMGTDLSVVNAARVSFGKKSGWVCSECGETNWVHDYDYAHYCETCKLGDELTLSEKDTKLIKYLASHKHMSPFGHCFASFHVKAPIFVARQLVKHKFLRWNEISRRYVDDSVEFYTPETWRGRSEDKKQGSEGVVLPEIDKTLWWASLELYEDLLDQGVAPEQARIVLPQSLLTEWYWSGSLDAFADMCNLRLKEDTQFESRLVAQQIDEEMSRLFPVSWSALVKKEEENV